MAERAPSTSRRARLFRDRIVELRRVRAGDLLEHPRNWRRHPERQRRALRGILAEIGYADALIAREEEGRLVLLDGHLRRSLDPEQIVPVLVVDLTAEEAERFLLTLDPLASLAEPDPEALESLLSDVHTDSAAVADLLRSLGDLAGIPDVRGRCDPDDIPDLPSTPRTSPADVWALGDHHLACADATAAPSLGLVLRGERADAMVTDPPYGVDYEGRTRGRLRIAGDSRDGLAPLLEDAFAQANAVLRPGAPIYVCHPAGPLAGLFFHAFAAQAWRIHQGLVWVKDSIVVGHCDYQYRHEPILYGYKPGATRRGRGRSGWYGGNDQDSIWEIPRPKASPEHPTAKPVELILRCLRNSTRRGEVLLDPFAGSGSALIACEQLGRRFAGVDIDPRYVDVAVRRWERFTGRRARRLPQDRRCR